MAQCPPLCHFMLKCPVLQLHSILQFPLPVYCSPHLYCMPPCHCSMMTAMTPAPPPQHHPTRPRPGTLPHLQTHNAPLQKHEASLQHLQQHQAHKEIPGVHHFNRSPVCMQSQSLDSVLGQHSPSPGFLNFNSM